MSHSQWLVTITTTTTTILLLGEKEEAKDRKEERGGRKGWTQGHNPDQRGGLPDTFGNL